MTATAIETESASIADSPMTWQQWRAVLVCVLLNVVDGIDILVMATAASAVKADLALSTSQLGALLSASLFGMMGGALLLAPIADRVGRRPMILCCLAFEFSGMLLAGFSSGFGQLFVCRLIAGFGVGGMMPIINTATAELASVRQRNLAITVQAIGYPLGGLIAALAGAMFLDAHGWRLLLQFACVPTLITVLLVIAYLPESIAFLAARRPSDALQRINRSLSILGRKGWTALPERGPVDRKKGFGTLLRPPVVMSFALFSVATFLAQFGFYFFMSWLPTVLAPHLATVKFPNASSIMLNLGGIVGDVIFAALCIRIAARKLALGMLMLAFGSIAILTQGLDAPAITTIMPLFTGGALFAAMAGIYATAPRVFAPLVRSAGTGVAFSLGRFGGALSPIVGAAFLGSDAISMSGALLLLAIPLLVAAALLFFLRENEEAIHN